MIDRFVRFPTPRPGICEKADVFDTAEKHVPHELINYCTLAGTPDVLIIFLLNGFS
jgi:hypothetical protein